MSKVKIFDFSNRLPGPLAAHILASKGLETFKVEDDHYPDPFNDQSFAEIDPIFKVWYSNFNQHKTLLKGNAEFIKEEVFRNLAEINIFLSSNSSKLKKTLGGGLPKGKKGVFVEIKAGKDDDRFMHDLNALAAEPIFKLHLKQTNLPPFIPTAGVCFAQDIANTALLAVLELEAADQEIFRTAFLKDSTKAILDPLWDKSLSFDHLYLHTGRFPCYRIYEAKDCKIAVAAVEEKFWNKFTQTFDLPLLPEDRLSSEDKVGRIIEQKLNQYQRQDLKKLALGQMCLTII